MNRFSFSESKMFTQLVANRLMWLNQSNHHLKKIPRVLFRLKLRFFMTNSFLRVFLLELLCYKVKLHAEFDAKMSKFTLDISIFHRKWSRLPKFSMSELIEWKVYQASVYLKWKLRSNDYYDSDWDFRDYLPFKFKMKQKIV